MRVLVTDGDSRATLAITRSLGRRGHEVLVAERTRPSLAGCSKHCVEQLVYVDPARDPMGFVRSLLDAVRSYRVDVLLPVAEVTTLLVSEHRASFEPECRLPLADAATIARASDKAEMLALAQRLDVPVPRTVVITDANDLPADVETLGTPIVIKPHRSRIRAGDGWMGASVSYAKDLSDLGIQLRRRRPEEFPILLQERLLGHGIGVFLCYDRGRLLAKFSHRRLREKPPSGGVSVLSESIPLSPELFQYSEALLRALNWQGVAMVEFKVDSRTNTPKLMEINARFWGSLQLAVSSGVDFPSILMDTVAGNGGPEPMAGYRYGVKNRWLWGDVDSLIIRLFKSDGLPPAPGMPGKVRSVVDFLRFYQRDLTYECLELSDLRPWLYETGLWLRGMRRS